jgi:hypothetical protein
LLLVYIDGTVRGAEFLRLSGFHFHKHQRAALPPDQIDLGRPASRPKIPSDHSEPATFQVTVRQVLAPPAAGPIGIPSLQPCAMPQRVERAI